MDNLSDDIIKYKKGELSPKQMHALERKALADPFLAEALEGAETISADELVADISAINERILHKEKTILFTPLRIAAGIVLLVASVFLVYQFVPRTENIALKIEKTKPENKNRKEEKANATRGDEIKKNESKKNKIEGRRLNAESEEQTSRNFKPNVSARKNSVARVQQPNTDNQGPKTKVQEPIGQTQAQGLALSEAQQQTHADIADDPKVKETIESEVKASSAQPIAIDKKKDSFAASTVQRSEAPSARIKTTKSISGHVVSFEDGSPLPGVSVILKSTTTGTVTDAKGNYTIHTDIDNSRLLFSFIGLQQQEVAAGGSDKIDVRMMDDASQPSEIVVTGVDVATDNGGDPVMKWAEPEGGRRAYDSYLEANVRYPGEALKNKVKGKAGIEFNVGTDGTLSDFTIIKKLGYGCEEEIIRLVKNGPKWFPTTEDSKPIKSTVKVRLRFDPAKARR